MKRDKNNLNLVERKDTKIGSLEESHISFLAIILGIVSVFISLSIGFFAYKYTLKITEERYHMFYMNKAKMLASIADSHKDSTKDILLSAIATSWRTSEYKPLDEYVCVVDKDANLILHTAHPDTIGKYVGNNLALDSQGKPLCRLQEIIQSQVDYVGNYISSRGQSQIAAFAAIPQRQWVLGVHRSKDALIKGIKANVFYFVLGFVIVCGFLLPVSLVLLYVTFKASNRKRMNVEEELRSLNKSLEQRVFERTEDLSMAIKGIKESDARFQSILSSLYEAAIVIFDRDGKIMSLWGTPEMDERYGISAAESVGSSFGDFIYPEHKEQMLAHIRNVIDTGEKILAEHIITVPGGNFWHEISLSPMCNDNGDINAAVGFFRDITERKQTAKELAQSRNSLTHAQQIAHLGSWEWDVVKNETLCSDELYRIHGLEPQQYTLTLEGFLELVHPEDKEFVKKSVTAALYEEKPYSIEFRIVRPDGTIRIVQSEAKVLFDKAGKPIRMIGTEQDITERVRAEEELRKIFDLSIDMICIVDIKNGYFRKINPAFGMTLGYSDEEILGRPFLDFIHPDDKNPTVRATEEMLDKGVVVSGFENRYRCKDGSYKWFMWTAKLNQEQGITYAVAHDITERKLVEDELKLLNETLEQRVTERTAELTKANKELVKMQKLESIGILAGGIAHDFNNNLQSILSCVTLAKTYANPKDEIYEKLEEAKKVVLQSKSLTQQLLTFSKGGEPVKNTISISKLINDSAKLALSGSNVRLELDLPNDLWPVEADKGQLNQVISNLIINADQAMPEGGNIKVWAENINVVEKGLLPVEEGNYVKITITDKGAGISQKHLQKIFDPYFTTKQKGSGLGLATCYSIIKKHDGHIDVESEVGVGTVFHIYLFASLIAPQKKPVLSKANGFSTEPVEEKEASGTLKGKVLLMDDEAIIRLAVARNLEQLNYEVETAGDGTEAIELYKKATESGEPFDAVVMDLTIPGNMGGREAIKRLLEIDPEVKVIVASGYVNDPILAEFRKHGFKGVLTKPYEIYEQEEMLRNVTMEMN